MSIERFREAQNSSYAGFDVALRELRAGGKRSHWIWYVFPQLEGLGRSEEAQRYGVKGIEEAAAFLRDPELRTRYHTIAVTVAEQLRTGGAPSLRALMGSDIDTVKLVSSLTLFGHVAGMLHAQDGLEDYAAIARVAEEILARAASEGYPSDAFTRRRLSE